MTETTTEGFNELVENFIYKQLGIQDKTFAAECTERVAGMLVNEITKIYEKKKSEYRKLLTKCEWTSVAEWKRIQK